MRACLTGKHADAPARTEFFGRRPPYLCPGPFNREHILGSVVGLMEHSAVHRRWSVADLHTWIVPPILQGQFFAFADGFKLVGFVTWARLTEEAEAGFLARSRPLAADDWNAGERVWFIDALAPFGHLPTIIRRVRAEMSARADREGWAAREGKWTRTFGAGAVQHVGRASRVDA